MQIKYFYCICLWLSTLIAPYFLKSAESYKNAKLRNWRGPRSFRSACPASGRIATSLKSVDGTIYLFGGYDTAGTLDLLYFTAVTYVLHFLEGPRNDLYSLSPATYEWTELGNNYTSGNPPSPRSAFGMTSTDDSLFIFGGGADSYGAYRSFLAIVLLVRYSYTLRC